MRFSQAIPCLAAVVYHLRHALAANCSRHASQLCAAAGGFRKACTKSSAVLHEVGVKLNLIAGLVSSQARSRQAAPDGFLEHGAQLVQQLMPVAAWLAAQHKQWQQPQHAAAREAWHCLMAMLCVVLDHMGCLTVVKKPQQSVVNKLGVALITAPTKHAPAFGTWAADLARWLLRDGFAVGTINNNCAWLLLWLWSSSTFLWDSWADNHAPLPDWMQATLGLHCQLLSGLFQQDSTTGQLCHDRGEARTAATFQAIASMVNLVARGWAMADPLVVGSGWWSLVHKEVLWGGLATCCSAADKDPVWRRCLVAQLLIKDVLTYHVPLAFKVPLVPRTSGGDWLHATALTKLLGIAPALLLRNLLLPCSGCQRGELGACRSSLWAAAEALQQVAGQISSASQLLGAAYYTQVQAAGSGSARSPPEAHLYWPHVPGSRAAVPHLSSGPAGTPGQFPAEHNAITLQHLQLLLEAAGLCSVPRERGRLLLQLGVVASLAAPDVRLAFLNGTSGEALLQLMWRELDQLADMRARSPAARAGCDEEAGDVATLDVKLGALEVPVMQPQAGYRAGSCQPGRYISAATCRMTALLVNFFQPDPAWDPAVMTPPVMCMHGSSVRASLSSTLEQLDAQKGPGHHQQDPGKALPSPMVIGRTLAALWGVVVPMSGQQGGVLPLMVVPADCLQLVPGYTPSPLFWSLMERLVRADPNHLTLEGAVQALACNMQQQQQLQQLQQQAAAPPRQLWMARNSLVRSMTKRMPAMRAAPSWPSAGADPLALLKLARLMAQEAAHASAALDKEQLSSNSSSSTSVPRQLGQGAAAYVASCTQTAAAVLRHAALRHVHVTGIPIFAMPQTGAQRGTTGGSSGSHNGSRSSSSNLDPGSSNATSCGDGERSGGRTQPASVGKSTDPLGAYTVYVKMPVHARPPLAAACALGATGSGLCSRTTSSSNSSMSEACPEACNNSSSITGAGSTTPGPGMCLDCKVLVEWMDDGDVCGGPYEQRSSHPITSAMMDERNPLGTRQVLLGNVFMEGFKEATNALAAAWHGSHWKQPPPDNASTSGAAGRGRSNDSSSSSSSNPPSPGTAAAGGESAMSGPPAQVAAADNSSSANSGGAASATAPAATAAAGSDSDAVTPATAAASQGDETKATGGQPLDTYQWFLTRRMAFVTSHMVLQTPVGLPGCCHSTCSNLSGPCEMSLVTGAKGVVCGGCRAVRFCSKECAAMHWQESHSGRCGLLKRRLALVGHLPAEQA